MGVSFMLDYGLCFLCKKADWRVFFLCEMDFMRDEIEEGERDEIVTEKRNFAY
ncbi:hypothetical protein ICU_04128 [Bacillus cereus BAG2X1-1]|nr:hypothetical protein ICU_04128 [Bacillus cereus BAG2X1-1]